MGDMAETFRYMREEIKKKKANQLAESSAIAKGFTQHTEYHFSTMCAGNRLDWWPSTRRWMYKQRLFYGRYDAMLGFMRNREKER